METRAVMFVHIYGRQQSVDDIRIAESMRVDGAIIEDLAEAHGIRPGPFTDAACFSFYRNKIIAGEEGGAVWFRNPKHATLARQLRSLGFTDAHDFRHVPRGHNYRMSNAHAGLILKSLANAEANIAKRRKNEQLLDRYCPAEWRMPARQSPWVYDLRIPGLTWGKQAEIVKALNDAGVAARRPFKPMHVQEEYKACRFVCADNVMPKSTLAAREVIYLPIGPDEVMRPAFTFDTIWKGVARGSDGG